MSNMRRIGGGGGWLSGCGWFTPAELNPADEAITCCKNEEWKHHGMHSLFMSPFFSPPLLFLLRLVLLSPLSSSFCLFFSSSDSSTILFLSFSANFWTLDSAMMAATSEEKFSVSLHFLFVPVVDLNKFKQLVSVVVCFTTHLGYSMPPLLDTPSPLLPIPMLSILVQALMLIQTLLVPYWWSQVHPIATPANSNAIHTCIGNYVGSRVSWFHTGGLRSTAINNIGLIHIGWF